jgi:hypothetical protein
MKKYLAVVLAIAMVLGLMLPVMAGPFADVPENHWAYEAVKQLAAYGLIQGFPDGTYKGQEPMTRYQMAIVVALPQKQAPKACCLGGSLKYPRYSVVP